MTQPSIPNTTQQASKILDYHNDDSPLLKQRRLTVRETVRQFDMLGKSNDLTSTSPPIIPIRNRNPQIATENHSSLSSSATSNDGEQKKTHLSDKSKPMTTLLTKAETTRARLDVRSKKQQKPSKSRPRTPPPSDSHQHREYKRLSPNKNLNTNHALSDQESEAYKAKHLQSNGKQDVIEDNKIKQPEVYKVYAKPTAINKDHISLMPRDVYGNDGPKIISNDHRHSEGKQPNAQSNQSKALDERSIGLEIGEPSSSNRRENNGKSNDNTRPAIPERSPTVISDYGTSDVDQNQNNFALSVRRPPPPPPPPFTASILRNEKQHTIRGEAILHRHERTCPTSNFMMEAGALFVIFILCLVLILAINENEAKLRITMQIAYTYVYLASISWMIWCTYDIIKFRREWTKLTTSAQDHEDYMDIAEAHRHKLFYYPNSHNNGGLFLKIGAGVLCMGGLVLTVIELAKTIALAGTDDHKRALFVPNYSTEVTVTKSMSYIFRFLFHCVQFTFLFRYGNLIIDRYHLIAKIGLIHVVIANFCTWFEANVFETLEQLHRFSATATTTTTTATTKFTTTTVYETTFESNITNDSLSYLFKQAAVAGNSSHNNQSALRLIESIESKMSVYLYPCLIEYSLISLTLFYIMWRNVGKKEGRIPSRFGDRHIFTINCSRASRGLVIGGIMLVSIIITLVPVYLVAENDEKEEATFITHITEFVTLVVSLVTVGVGYFHTTKLYYDSHAHVDAFDHALILITTFGNFAYSFFSLFASMFVTEKESNFPNSVETIIGFLAILQTFVQTAFILDALKRRVKHKDHIRNKPGREAITALLLMNLSIWLHDSLSAKKARFNPSQTAYYDESTWAIIQAFTSPLSIFYRFHSSVCLADIWQEIYQNDQNQTGTKHLSNMSGSFLSEH